MARIIVLDAGPIGLAIGRPDIPDTAACLTWLASMETAGVEVVVPTVADYEVRRELVRIGATAKLRRLDQLAARFDVVDVLGAAFHQAAEFWATVRRLGLPTAADSDIDADAIIAGVAATIGADGVVVTIATTNVRHLARFPGIDARVWNTIT